MAKRELDSTGVGGVVFNTLGGAVAWPFQAIAAMGEPAKDREVFSFVHSLDRDAVIATISEDANARNTKLDMRALEGKSAEQALMAYARDKGDALPRFNETPLTKDEAERLGAALLRMEDKTGLQGRPDVEITDSNGVVHKLETKELSAYLQNAAEEGHFIDVGAWVAKNQIGLTGHGHMIGEDARDPIYVETAAGDRRIVSNGAVTKPMKGGSYGSVPGVAVGDGDDLDIYVSEKARHEIVTTHDYTGPIFVMQQMKKGNPDELKVGFADLQSFHDMQASTWGKPQDFEKKNQGAYAQLSRDQYEQLKTALKENPTLTLETFASSHNISLLKGPVTVEKKLEAPVPEESAVDSLPLANTAILINTIGGLGLLSEAKTKGLLADPEVGATYGLALNELHSFFEIEGEDHFGPNTKAAVIKFQQNKGIEANGIVGAETLGKMREVLGGGVVAPAAAAPEKTEAGSFAATAEAIEVYGGLGQLSGKRRYEVLKDPTVAAAMEEVHTFFGLKEKGFGPATSKAVRSFETKNGLRLDGQIGPEVLNKMRPVGAAPN